MNYFLAIDIGASSGRHLLGYLDNGRLKTEEVYRFNNHISDVNGQLCWDLTYLFEHIVIGMAQCSKVGKIPKTVGINTWGVDFVLLDENDQCIGNSVSYRDQRTRSVMNEICDEIGIEKIYSKTGIQFMDFNTICQLKVTPEEYKKKAKSFLMIPDYLNFLLTGVKSNEYTNATTTQLYNIEDDSWDEELISVTGINSDVFYPPKKPLSNLGGLKNNIAEKVGFDCDVILPATHDTGSAFIASVLDVDDSGIVLSSGTWSLLGKELMEPVITEQSRIKNFANNKGGFGQYYRFMKNIMGLWIIQEISRNLDNRYSFSELVDMAKEHSDFNSIVDVNDKRFFLNDNMIEEIINYCNETEQVAPSTVGEVCACVYRSLAVSYKKHIDEFIEITGKKIDKINIIGGGCKNEFLNLLIEKETGKKVICGPVEATSVGNIICQMIADKEILSLSDAKEIIKQSEL